jgi:Na+-transporting methylmalonyl-CoA/oxaloacetate decarboxylase beta subunit
MFGLFETGFQFFYWGNLLMLIIGGALIYLGIARKMEPLLLVPIGFGILLINLPLGGLMDYELPITNTGEVPGRVLSIEVDETSRIGESDVILRLDSGEVTSPVTGRVKEILVAPGQQVAPGELMAVMLTTTQTPLPTTPVGLLSRIFQYGIMWQIIPPLIFLCLGALTDFGPMLANPKTLLLGAAAQFGVYFAFFAALGTGFFNIAEAASIGIIGGAEGPTTILPQSWHRI